MPHTPIRMCAMCRQRFNKVELTRYTLDSQDNLVRDERLIMPGRGWYVCSHTTCMDRFTKFKPGLKRQKGLQSDKR